MTHDLLRTRAARTLALVLFAALVLPACDGEGPGSATGDGTPNAWARPRSEDPRVIDARRALEEGRADSARTLLAQLGDSAGIEGFLLRARLADLLGDEVGAIAQIETARSAWPGDGRVPATMAELNAWHGRAAAAEEEIRRGLLLDPECPDLERARGVLFLTRPGQARLGLEHLERALELDPELPFVRHPLVQAHILVSRLAMAEGDLVSAVVHAREARKLDPASAEARETLAEAYVEALRFDDALELYEELLRERRVAPEKVAQLHKRAATTRLMQSERERALVHWIRARELGLPDAELGHGLTELQREAADRVEIARRLLAGAEPEEARAHLASALRYDPDSIAARNELGILEFKTKHFDEAVAIWAALLDEARAAGADGTDPVHLNLARAYRNADRLEEAQRVLERYLADHPDGEWASDTADLHWALERELAARTGDH